ncbi:MAG: ABC transporter permease [Moorea sp. SIO3C2]|nr:ABC transporter permease [Moorena sp. SIO3C2]
MKVNSVTFWGIYSVWHRHAKVYQRTWLVNSILPLSEPVIYLIAFGYGLTPLVGDIYYHGQPTSYLNFIAAGMIGIGVLFQSFSEGAYGSFVRLSIQKTWNALLTAPLTFMEVFLGEWLWAATKGTITGIITGLVVVIWGLYSGWQLLLSLPVIILGSMLFGALGLLTAGTVRTVDQINVPIFLFVIPMFTLCGTYFPRDTLPTGLGYVAAVLPLSSMVDLLRWPLGLPEFWFLELIWLLVCTAVFYLLAWRQIYPILFR